MKTKPDSMIEKVKAFIRMPYAWPGGYPLFAWFNDGDVCCKECAKSEFRQIIADTKADDNCGWNIKGVDVNWEQPDLYCAHCDQPIESAYGVPA